jgi:hypothetical protein
MAADACVIARGCFPFVCFIQQHRAWIPGAWCRPDNLVCSTYYAHFGPYLLNGRHRFLSGAEAMHERDVPGRCLSPF